MSVRVIARVRPLLKSELSKDAIVEVVAESSTNGKSSVKIPNPRNEAEAFTFDFNNVYDENATQQQIFDDEIAPTVKSLFKGIDVTVFAYGVTGTGKTHTMRGGRSLADRGIIPRLLSNIYRRARKIEKDSEGKASVEVAMSYYEIYCDRVHDLFEPLDKRSAAGLPIRDNGGKSIVVGLTERPCTSLKEFETLYDQANINRSTSATKLNAHSSRSHAILSVRVTQTTDNCIQVSTVSAIDLAGSEDNRRTENDKDRMIESSAINKSLFVLAQCVEAISKKQARIPYRESKMTRILSLGQNNGVTIMILNLAPVRSYHLDTLSSLNFANRTKKIEVNEAENQLIYRPNTKVDASMVSTVTGQTINRQPLRPKAFSANIMPRDWTSKAEKPVKSFTVFAEQTKPRPSFTSQKRTSSDAILDQQRPSKIARTMTANHKPTTLQAFMTNESIEALIDRKVAEKMASVVYNASLPVPSTQALSKDVQARLDALEERVQSQESEKEEALQYLLLAKQHRVRGEESSALKMYQLALPYFPTNQKLIGRIRSLEHKLSQSDNPSQPVKCSKVDFEDQSFLVEAGGEEEEEEKDDDEVEYESIKRSGSSSKTLIAGLQDSPRTKALLKIINTRDLAQIRLLRGVGAKKAEMIVQCLVEQDMTELCSMADLGSLRGVGMKGVEKMREGLVGVC